VFNLAWIDLKSQLVRVVSQLTRVAMEFDGVSEPSGGYNCPVDYEHGYRHGHDYACDYGHGHGQAGGPEPSDADEGLAGRG